MDWHDQQDLARYRRRKKKQREYQAAYRDRLGKEKTPERDDMAAELMRVYLDVLVVDHKSVADITRAMIKGLAAKGFGREVTLERLKAMAVRAQDRRQRSGASDIEEPQ